METLEPKLESLLMSKAFDTLNAEERLLVSAFLTEEQYNAYHLILKHTVIGVQESDDALIPAAGIPEHLKAYFSAKRRRPFRFGVSVKQLSIAACLFLAVSLGIVWFKAKMSDKVQVIQTQAKVDLNGVHSRPKESAPDVLEKPLKHKLVSRVKPARKLKEVSKIKPVEATDSTEKFYGLHVQDPMLGLEIDVNDQLLGLHF